LGDTLCGGVRGVEKPALGSVKSLATQRHYALRDRGIGSEPSANRPGRDPDRSACVPM
jgi:hypothetical protein